MGLLKVADVLAPSSPMFEAKLSTDVVASVVPAIVVKIELNLFTNHTRFPSATEMYISPDLSSKIPLGCFIDVDVAFKPSPLNSDPPFPATLIIRDNPLTTREGREVG